jgi:hypothetical protein
VIATVHLDDASVNAVAERVVELLRAESIGGDLIDSVEVARRFSVSRDYVYEHAEELGAMRLGSGSRARLRFDPATVRERLHNYPFVTLESLNEATGRPFVAGVQLSFYQSKVSSSDKKDATNTVTKSTNRQVTWGRK